MQLLQSAIRTVTLCYMCGKLGPGTLGSELQLPTYDMSPNFSCELCAASNRCDVISLVQEVDIHSMCPVLEVDVK